MITRSISIHIGGNKTGSTSLQRLWLSRDSRLRYAGQEAVDWESYRVHSGYVLGMDTSSEEETLAKDFFSRILDDRKNQPFVLSDEDIMFSSHPNLSSQRLACLFPDARVIMVVREQVSALLSYYLNHGSRLRSVPRPFFNKFVSPEDWFEYELKYHDRRAIEAFNYSKTFDIYSKAFDGRVEVLFYEDMIKDPVSFYQSFANVIGVDLDENCVTRLTSEKQLRTAPNNIEFFIRKHAALPRIRISDFVSKFGRRIRVEDVFSKSLVREIQAIYAVGNRKLDSTLDNLLGAKGYCIEVK